MAGASVAGAVRLFVAAWPPEHVVDALEALHRPARPAVRWTTWEQWHVTLRFLGSLPSPAPASAALEALRAEPAEAVLGPVVTTLGRDVLVVPVGGLDGLARSVVAATAGVGEPPPDRPFSGHVTLARSRQGVGVAGLAGPALAASWLVDEVCLVGSELRPEGARYEILARVALSGR